MLVKAERRNPRKYARWIANVERIATKALRGPKYKDTGRGKREMREARARLYSRA